MSFWHGLLVILFQLFLWMREKTSSPRVSFRWRWRCFRHPWVMSRTRRTKDQRGTTWKWGLLDDVFCVSLVLQNWWLLVLCVIPLESSSWFLSEDRIVAKVKLDTSNCGCWWVTCNWHVRAGRSTRMDMMTSHSMSPYLLFCCCENHCIFF